MMALAPSALQQRLTTARQRGHLDLSGAGLASVPPGVWDLALPAETQPQQQQPRRGQPAVNLDWNSGGSGDAWWEQADAVTRMNLSRNQLADLGPAQALGAFTGLVVLDASFNALAALPAGIARCGALEFLSVKSNRLRELFPEGCGALAAPGLLGDRLAHLDASLNQLTSVPPRLGLLPCLRALHLADNALPSLPSLAGCRVLETLDASRNRLSTLPPLPPSLGFCLAESNALASLGPSFDQPGSLPALRELHAGMNRLVAFPAGLGLGGCPALASLALQHNRLASLPAGMAPSLPSLRVLNLANNAIADAGPVVGLRLERLNLEGNALRELPPALGLMASLAALAVQGNPIKSIPQAALSGPLSGLMALLRDRIPRSSKANNGGAAVLGEDLADPSAASAGWGPCAPGGPSAEVERRVRQAATDKRLDLSSMGLARLPEAAWDSPGTERVAALSLAGNALGELSAGVGRMAGLTSLDVSGNAPLGALPRELVGLQLLAEVRLARCTGLRELRVLPHLRGLLRLDLIGEAKKREPPSLLPSICSLSTCSFLLHLLTPAPPPPPPSLAWSWTLDRQAWAPTWPPSSRTPASPPSHPSRRSGSGRTSCAPCPAAWLPSRPCGSLTRPTTPSRASRRTASTRSRCCRCST